MHKNSQNKTKKSSFGKKIPQFNQSPSTVCHLSHKTGQHKSCVSLTHTPTHKHSKHNVCDEVTRGEVENNRSKRWASICAPVEPGVVEGGSVGMMFFHPSDTRCSASVFFR